MDNILDTLSQLIENPLVRLILIVLGILVILKIIYEVLKMTKFSSVQDKSFVDAFWSMVSKKSFMVKQARAALKKGNFHKAGNLFENIGDYRRALKAYEEGKEFNAMGELYEKLNKETLAIEVYKNSGNVDGMIRLYLKRKNIEAAGNLLENNNRFQEAAELYYNYERYERAAQIYEKKGFYKKAAYIYEKAGNDRKAAQNFEKWFLTNADTSVGYSNLDQLDEDLFKSVQLYIKIGETERAFRLLKKYEKFEKAGELAFKTGKIEEAAKLFEQAQMPLRAADMYEKLGQDKAAFQLRGEDAFARGDTLQAAEFYLKGEDYTRAAELFEWDHQFEKAGYCYFMNQNYLSAAENYLKASNEEEAAKMFELGQQWKSAAEISLKYKKYQKAGELFEKAEDYYNAGSCFVKVDDDSRALANFQKVKSNAPDYQDAVTNMANIFLKNRKPQLVIEKISKLLQDQPINKSNLEWYYVLGQAYENAGEFKKAFEIFQGITAEDYSFKDIHNRLQAVEKLIKKYKEMELVSDNKSTRYRIIKKVGEGGMGTVLKAEDTVLQRVVALKILNTNLIKDKVSLERFYTEARSTASLSHPNIVTVYDVGQMEGDHFISMEFIEGENFINLIRRKKVFTVPQILFIAIKILKALDYSHKKGITHRDIKPHNIMITQQKEIKIMDFGLAVIRGDLKKGETGIITGTPYYMSPEQIQGIIVDHRTDIYSTGATLFHIITGKVPFKGENIFYQHLFEPMPSIRELRSDVPESLEEMVGKCMQKKREDRFQSAQDVLHQIKSIKL